MRSRATVLAALAALAMTAVGCTASGTDSSPASYVADTRQLRLTVALGCPAALGSAHDVRNPAHGLTGAMVPREALPRGGLVCSYRPTARDTMVRLTRTVLSARSAQSLAAAIARVSLKPVTKTYVCGGGPADNVDVIALDYAAGPVDLWYARYGCPTLDNGHVQAFGMNNDSFVDFAQILSSLTR